MKKLLRIVALVLVLLLAAPLTLASGSGGDGLAAAIAAQERHTPGLFQNPEVVGTGVGLAADGSAVIQVLAASAAVHNVPRTLDGIAVTVEVTGRFYAVHHREGHTGGPTAAGGRIDTKSHFARPVPIGVSTGNALECAAGTIGGRVKDGAGNVYALSNNHVYARQNSAAIGEEVLQPGRYDTNCVYDANNHLGNLSAFVPILFGGADNHVDAAIASSTTALLGNSTPSNGYGTPKSTAVTAFVGQRVQKYGRTSSLTKGQVTAINLIVNVGYSGGTARFVDQIRVDANKPFLKSGDSGSLLVSEPGADPVGLLFAATIDGKIAIANKIGRVLNAFGVTVDGS